jgi:four helix bundle protein
MGESWGVAHFKKLLVWRKAHALSLRSYHVAQTIRGSQQAALRNQLVRAADSIPANIVEGRAAASDAEFARFVSYAIASAAELEHHLMTARERGVMATPDFRSLMAQLIEVRKMLYGLRRRLRDAVKDDQSSRLTADR